MKARPPQEPDWVTLLEYMGWGEYRVSRDRKAVHPFGPLCCICKDAYEEAYSAYSMPEFMEAPLRAMCQGAEHLLAPCRRALPGQTSDLLLSACRRAEALQEESFHADFMEVRAHVLDAAKDAYNENYTPYGQRRKVA